MITAQLVGSCCFQSYLELSFTLLRSLTFHQGFYLFSLRVYLNKNQNNSMNNRYWSQNFSITWIHNRYESLRQKRDSSSTHFYEFELWRLQFSISESLLKSFFEEIYWYIKTTIFIAGKTEVDRVPWPQHLTK